MAGIDAAGAVRVLIVDDDPKLRSLLVRGLAEHGIAAEAVADTDAALARLASPAAARVDAMLLDVMLPGRSGFELLELMKTRGGELPVLFVSARRAVEDRVRGLRLGADDYIVKPFALDELLARLEAVLRRRGAPQHIELGPLALDLTTRTVRADGLRLELSPREFDLLRNLVEADGAVVSREELLRRVWGIEFDPGTNVVDATVARLRRRFSSRSFAPVETVVGRGYRCSLGRLGL